MDSTVQQDELLEPFPSNSRTRSDSFSLPDVRWSSALMNRFSNGSSTTKSPVKIPQRNLNDIQNMDGDPSIPRDSREESRIMPTLLTMMKGGFYNDNDSVINLSSRTDGLDDSTGSGYDPISVASVVGDKEEFRKLQEDLRQSRMLTGVGTHQVLNKYIESRRRAVEEKRQNDEELSKVKYFEPPSQQSKKQLSSRLSRGINTIR